MAKFYKYTATGKGYLPFPVDMLRYDWAFPASTDDAITMSASIRNDYTGPKPAKVNLISTKKPTGDRWESFSWVIGPVKVIQSG